MCRHEDSKMLLMSSLDNLRSFALDMSSRSVEGRVVLLQIRSVCYMFDSGYYMFDSGYLFAPTSVIL